MQKPRFDDGRLWNVFFTVFHLSVQTDGGLSHSQPHSSLKELLQLPYVALSTPFEPHFELTAVGRC
jgi:hypothetical protein